VSENHNVPTLLSVNNYYYHRGGADSVFLEHNALFEAAGWNVVPFAMAHEANLPTPWARHFVEEIEFGRSYSTVGKITRVAKAIYSLEARRKLAKLIDLTSPDVCHAHNIYHHISPSILGLLGTRGVPVVLTLHDLKIACPAYSMLAADGICERCKGGRLHNVIVHRCLKGSLALSSVAWTEAVVHKLLGSYRRWVGRFVVPSRFYGTKLAEWGLPAGKITHIPNFIDVRHYRPQYAPGDAFLYFGRLSREKGLATLLKAAAGSKSKLLIAGTGPQKEGLERLAGQLGVEAQFLGYLRGEPLHAAIRSARAVVLPSEWYENAPLSILEAYALGKPVVGARVGGIPELVREGETGYCFESGNAEALGNTLNRMSALAAEEVAVLGRAGRAWVESEFTPERYLARVQALYGELGVTQARVARRAEGAAAEGYR
jgi:glycosyltransferase involved in cell wall biosynthesis